MIRFNLNFKKREESFDLYQIPNRLQLNNLYACDVVHPNSVSIKPMFKWTDVTRRGMRNVIKEILISINDNTAQVTFKLNLKYIAIVQLLIFFIGVVVYFNESNLKVSFAEFFLCLLLLAFLAVLLNAAWQITKWLLKLKRIL